MRTWTGKSEIPDQERKPFDPDQQWQALCEALHWPGTEEELEEALRERWQRTK
jgi:hypothetical protein